MVSPDPDGAGAMKMRAVRNTYDSHGFLTKVEKGNVNSQSDTDWAGFTSLQEVNTAYDANGRAVTQSVASGGTTYALTQTSYDALGRLQCAAQRMNPAAFGSLPSDACTLGTAGSYGNDRIVKTSYDYVSRPTLVQSAYGVTGTQADEVSTVYTDNSKTASVTDAEGNKTSYVYDGFDRLSQTRYPSGLKGAGTSNAADYEQLGYDANGNVTSRRLRDGNSIGLTYDALNRATYKDLPNTATYEFDVSYTYDLLGHLTQAQDTNTHHVDLTWTRWGGRRGRRTISAPARTATTRLGGERGSPMATAFYVDYDYLVTGAMAHVRENGPLHILGCAKASGMLRSNRPRDHDQLWIGGLAFTGTCSLAAKHLVAVYNCRYHPCLSSVKLIDLPASVPLPVAVAYYLALGSFLLCGVAAMIHFRASKNR